MNEMVQLIPISNLTLMFIPVIIVIGILYYWSLETRHINIRCSQNADSVIPDWVCLDIHI